MNETASIARGGPLAVGGDTLAARRDPTSYPEGKEAGMTTTTFTSADSKLPRATRPVGTPASAGRRLSPTVGAPWRPGGWTPWRPGACSIDVMAVVHNFKFGWGPNPSSGNAMWEAEALGLITTRPAAVTPRGEQALQEHGWLSAGGQQQSRITAWRRFVHRVTQLRHRG